MKFYRINVSGVKYFLTEENLKSDAPNIFTQRFEKFPKSTRMAVARNPCVFAAIHLYLQGYNIFPVPEGKFKEHLLQDASFYGLKSLEEALIGGDIRETQEDLWNSPIESWGVEMDDLSATHPLLENEVESILNLYSESEFDLVEKQKEE